MINFNALFKISYGLYVVCSGNKKQSNGFIANTVMQISSAPVQVAVCCNKYNFTAELIKQTGALSITILPQTVSPELIGIFGYESGRNTDKMQNFDIRYGVNDVPVLMSEAIATIECKVKQTVDVETHLLYICDVEEAEMIHDAEPITYDYYRKIRKGLSPKNAPTYVEELTEQTSQEASEKHRCLVCGYIYDDAENDLPFADLETEWECPVCRATKAKFIKIQ